MPIETVNRFNGNNILDSAELSVYSSPHDEKHGTDKPSRSNYLLLES